MKITQQKLLNVIWIILVTVGTILSFTKLRQEADPSGFMVLYMGVAIIIATLAVMFFLGWLLMSFYEGDFELFEPFEIFKKSEPSSTSHEIVNEILEAERNGDEELLNELLDKLEK